MTELMIGFVALLLGAAVGWLLHQLAKQGQHASLRDRLQDREQQLTESQEALDQERRLKGQAQTALAAERERSNQLQERMAEHKRELDGLQQQFVMEF